MSLADEFAAIPVGSQKGAAPAQSDAAPSQGATAPSEPSTSLSAQFDATPATPVKPDAPASTTAAPTEGAAWGGGELGRQLGLTTRALGHGVADAVDLVGAPLNATINTLFGAHLHNPGDTIRGGVDALTPAPQNALERVVGAGASSMASAGLGAGAASGISKFAVNPIVSAIGGQMAAQPAAQLAAGAGSGVSSQGAQEAGANPLMQMGAGVLGGLAGYGSGAGVASGANRLAGAISHAETIPIASRVEPTLPPAPPKPNYVPNGDGTFTQTAPKPYVGVGDVIPQPGAAQVAVPAPAQPAELTLANASPQLKAAIASEKGPIDPETLGRHLEADSLPVPVSLTQGQATQDVSQLSAEQNMRGKVPALAQRFNEQNGQLIQNADAIRDAAAPDVTATNHIENGQSLIDAYKAKDAALSADISKKYKALEDANGGQFPVDGPSFVDSANQALAQKMKASFLPAEVRSLMDGIQNGDQPMNFQNFEELRTTLAAAARKAERAGDGNQAMAVSLVRNSLESLPMTGETAAIKPLADAARSAAKARFDLLGADPAYKAAVNDTVAPDDFIQKFVVGGKQGNLQAMQSNLADDPLAQQAIASGAVNWLKSKAGIDTRTNTGNFSQAGYNKGLAELTPRIGEIFTPETAQQVKTLGNVARYTQAQPRGSYVNNSNTFVSQAAHTVGSALEGAANVAAHGIPVGTWTKNALVSRMGQKEVGKILKPGAGVSR